MDQSLTRHIGGPSFRAWMARAGWRGLGRAVLTITSLGLLVVAFRTADLSRAIHLIAGAPGLWIIPLPSLLALACDTAAWRRLLAASGTAPGFRTLLETRLSAEAVAMSLPSGTVLGEAAALYLVKLRSGIATSQAAASLVSRRLHVTFAHGVTLAAAGVLGFHWLREASARMTPGGGLVWVAPVGAVTLIAVALLAPGWIEGGSVGRRFPGLVDALRLCGTPARAPANATSALYVAMWVLESMETLLILRVLGSGLEPLTVFSFDSVLALARGLAIFTPAGLGIQDAGYVAFLGGLADPEAATMGAALVIVKRAREVVFAAAGFLLLALRTGGRVPSSGVQEAAAWCRS